MLYLIKSAGTAKICVTAVRTLSSALQTLQAVPQNLSSHDVNGQFFQFTSEFNVRADPVLSAVWRRERFYRIGDGLAGKLPTDLCMARHRFRAGPIAAAFPWPIGWAQRAKHTRAGHAAGIHRGVRADTGTNNEQRPRRRLPRFKPSRKIMNTSSLKELGELTAAEVAGWKPKELAAAARRAVSLWRREQPRASARVQMMQRLQLLPLLPPATPTLAMERLGNAAGGAATSPTHDATESSPSSSTIPSTLPAAAAAAAAATATVTATTNTTGTELPTATAVAATAQAITQSTTHPSPHPSFAAVEGFRAAPPAPSQRSSRVTGGVYSTSLVMKKPLRPHELRLAQLVERLVRAANGRLTEGFGSRELSSFVWSLVALGYWQPPLVPLVSAFADYGAERLRASDPIAMAMLLQVLAKARAAAGGGGDGGSLRNSAAKLLELAPATATVAAASLPSCLPSCEARTLAGLLHSCAVLLSTRSNYNNSTKATGGVDAYLGGEVTQAGTAAAAGESGSGSGSRSLDSASSSSRRDGLEMLLLGGRTANALTALAQEVVKECVRRRFIGFGPTSLVTAAGALAALHHHQHGSDPSLISCGGSGRGVKGRDDGAAAWAMLASAAVSPTAPQMAGATPQQWTMLLRIAKLRGGPNQQALIAGATSAGAVAGVGTTTTAERSA